VKTRAAVLETIDHPLTVVPLEVVEPDATDVVVRLAASGVCHTDRHVITGAMRSPLPVVLGHEGVGVVEDVGSAVQFVEPGDTVVLISAPTCGRCWYCARGETVRCTEASRIRGVARFSDGDHEPFTGFAGLGTFSEYVTVCETMVVPVRTQLPAEQLALVGCGVVTGVGAVLTASVGAGSSVVVIGCGGVGLSVVQGARAVGATEIIAVDPVAMKREAACALGATVAVDPVADDVGAVARSLTGGRGADVAFEAVGSSRLAVEAMRATRPGGTTHVIGVSDPDEVLDISSSELLFTGRTLAGSLYGGGNPHRLIPELVAMAEAGRIDLAAMVTRTIDLEQVNEAFDAMDGGDVVRSVIVY
jgi:S-(hydroxymethyl)glutathione dehydrogenase / alcohol dehydrogenase